MGSTPLPSCRVPPGNGSPVRKGLIEVSTRVGAGSGDTRDGIDLPFAGVVYSLQSVAKERSGVGFHPSVGWARAALSR